MTDAAPDALQRSQRVLAASQDGFWERNLRTGLIWYSDSFLRLFGLGEGVLLATRGAATARVHPDDRARFVAAYDNALRRISGFAYDIRFLDGAGQWRWVRGRGQVWADAQGRAEFISGAVTDVHRRQTELQVLADQQHALQALVKERTAGLEEIGRASCRERVYLAV